MSGNQKRNDMKTFKNINFIKRDYESTNVVFCQGEKAPDSNWVECGESELTRSTCNHLQTQNGVRFFGWL